MSINAVAPFPSTPTLRTQFTSSSGAQRSTPSSTASPSGAFDNVTIHTPSSLANIGKPVGSFNFKIDGQSSGTTISNTGEEYTATLPGLGTVSGPSEASVDAAINVRISELA